MIRLTHAQASTLRDWFLPEQPGPVIGAHVLQTGHGAIRADRWPAPGAVLAECAGNYALSGNPRALDPSALQDLIMGFVAAPPAFEPLLRAAFPDLNTWPRVVMAQMEKPVLVNPRTMEVRRLVPADAHLLEQLDPDSTWISKTWGGAAGLAASGCAWGALVGGRLASVACTFFLGYDYEEVGVVTGPGFRGRSLSTACAGALCRDIHARRRQPSWTTSPDNLPSLRVAEKLGFRLHRHDVLYVVGVEIPPSSLAPAGAGLEG